MPTTLGRSYQLDWRGKPPHMLDVDMPVWYSFLDSWGFQFKSLYYDVTLGGPDFSPEQLLDPFVKLQAYLASKRADAIAELENELWILEVTGDCRLRSIGQLQVYRALWIRDPVISKPEKCVVVCETISPDILDAASMYGIMVFAQRSTTF